MRVLFSLISKPASASTLLFQLLLSGVSFESLLDKLSFVAELEWKLMHVIIFIMCIAKRIMFGGSARLTILSLGVILTHPVMALGGLNTDILAEELISGEIVHEVLAGDEASLLISVFKDDLVKSLENGLHDLLEAEAHSLLFLVVSSNVLTELLIDLLDHAVEPVTHVGVGELDLLVHLSGLLVELLSGLDLDVKLVDLRVGRTALHDLDVLVVRVLHLELVELLSD